MNTLTVADRNAVRAERMEAAMLLAAAIERGDAEETGQLQRQLNRLDVFYRSGITRR